MDTTIDIAEFAKTLGLDQSQEGLFFGRRSAFPIGFKVIDPLGSPLLLFQVRHPATRDAKVLSAITYGQEVQQLIAEKKLDVDFDDHLAWLSLVEGAKHLTGGSAPRLLDSILGSFSAAGLALKPNICHYCQRNEVEALSCIEGKVVQICPICLSERVNAPENRPPEATEGAMPIAMLAPLASFVGALGWALFWMGYVLLFEHLKTDKIYVPRLVEMAALLCVAFVTGGPVGYVIKRVGRCGKKLSVGFGILCTVAAVILGEVLFVAWLIYREFKVFSLSLAWNILPRLEMALGGFHLIVKLLAAMVAVVVALELAKPPKPRLKL